MRIAISALRRLVAGLRSRGRQLGLAAVGLTALACSAVAEPQLEKTEIRYQGWAGQVTFIELADDLGYLAPLKLKWIGNTISGPQDIQTVVTGDIDIGGAFYGAIIKLIAAKAPIKGWSATTARTRTHTMAIM